jgi:hypothetical protein
MTLAERTTTLLPKQLTLDQQAVTDRPMWHKRGGHRQRLTPLADAAAVEVRTLYGHSCSSLNAWCIAKTQVHVGTHARGREGVPSSKQKARFETRSNVVVAHLSHWVQHFLQEDVKQYAAAREDTGPFYQAGAVARLRRRVASGVLDLSNTLWSPAQLASVQVCNLDVEPGCGTWMYTC